MFDLFDLDIGGGGGGGGGGGICLVSWGLRSGAVLVVVFVDESILVRVGVGVVFWIPVFYLFHSVFDEFEILLRSLDDKSSDSVIC